MPSSKQAGRQKLPGRFEDLIRRMPPRAITDDIHYQNTVEMIDHVMASGKLTKGQALYLETLVQLVEAYEASHHAIATSDLSGLDLLKHLLDESAMSATDLGRLLGVHPSMGSTILKGDRSLTIDHLKKLSARFKVSPDLFIS